MIDTSKIYTSNNYGQFKIINYVDCKNVIVEFIDTGYITTSRSDHITEGRIKDLLHPSVCGVGFIGEGKYTSGTRERASVQYSAWKSMLRRCYCDKYQERQPTYKGCSVHKEWHNYQNFAKWHDENYIEGYQIDKDIKVNGNKLYGPDTCMYVSPADNTIKAHAKKITLVSPSGVATKIYNTAQFARDNNLNQGALSAVSLNNKKSHKGWTKA